ncbi:MAG TPA: hypothetical protein VF647_12540 [Longimicrobium sp.]
MAADGDTPTPKPESDESIRSWVMIGLTAVFVALYVAALFNVIRPLADDRVVMRLESIVGVIIGYYFGRVPGEKNEKTLKEEVNRQAGKAKAEEQKKEQAQREKGAAEQRNGALEMKVKSIGAVLSPAPHTVREGDHGKTFTPTDPSPVDVSGLRHTLAAAIRVLDAE